MKITLPELIIEIIKIRDEALDYLRYMHSEKQSCNSFRAGLEEGQFGACQRILDIIENGIEEEI